MSGTGGGPSKFFPLTPLEEEVASLLSMNDSVNGTPGIKNFGCLVDEVESTEASPSGGDNVVDAMDRCHANETNIATQDTTPDDKYNLLKTQVQNQIKYQEKSVKKLNDTHKNTFTFTTIIVAILC